MNECSVFGNDLVVESSLGVQWIDLRQISRISAYGTTVDLLSGRERIATLSIFKTREAYEEYNKLGESERRSELLLSLRADMIATLKKAISDVRAANV